MTLGLLALVTALVVGWILWQPSRTRARQARDRARPFPDDWREMLNDQMPLYRVLPPALRTQLEGHVRVFLADKEFIGCDGLEITDEMRLLVAGQACLLILNRPTTVYAELRQILIYPEAFIVDREEVDEDGVLHREQQVLTGESWAESQVILSWPDVEHGAAVADDGENVVIHEFAHQLDQETGYANGAPELAGRNAYARWATVLGEEFERLRDRIDAGEETLLDDYGATDPVEFFAVVSEAFYEQPALLRREHPALYDELARFYRLDPANGWLVAPTA